MKNFWVGLMMTGILAATTVGAGIFALPYIFQSAGWLSSLIWLFVLTLLVSFAGYSYWRVLGTVNEKQRLVGLARTYLGREWGSIAFFSVLGGMLFALIIYLVLAQRFFMIIFPLKPIASLVLFWALAVMPATFSIRRFAAFENTGTFLKCALIVFVFVSAGNYHAVFENNISFASGILLPFGAILFALSGWNAIEPMYELWKSSSEKNRPNPLTPILTGTAVISLLYFLFSAGILGSLSHGSFVSPDTLSGLIGWPFWKIGVLAVLGLLALWTAYGINAREIENALQKDMRWHPTLAFAVVALSPLLVVLLGFSNIIQAITFAGAVFAGLQYIIIFLLAERVLKPGAGAKWLMRFSALVFAIAALYEVYAFMVG